MKVIKKIVWFYTYVEILFGKSFNLCFHPTAEFNSVNIET